MAKDRISDEDFVRAWMRVKTYAELAAATEMTVSQCQQRGYRLRKRGVPLPTMFVLVGSKRPVDVVGLNKIIEEEGRKGRPI